VCKTPAAEGCRRFALWSDISICYTSTMFNKTFYRFLFSFIAVIAFVLVFILIIGSSGVQ
jgi:hypothetical protein